MWLHKLGTLTKLFDDVDFQYLSCFFKHKQTCSKWQPTLISTTVSSHLSFPKKWWLQISSTTVPSYSQFLFCYVVFSWTVSWLVFMLLGIKMNGVAKQIMLHGQRDTTLAVEMFLVVLLNSIFTEFLYLI